MVFHAHRWTFFLQDKRVIGLLPDQHMTHKWKQIRDRHYHPLWIGSQCLVEFQIPRIFVWMKMCISGWELSHVEEPIHSEFNPSQKESFWLRSRCETSEKTLSVLEPYRELDEIFHSLSLRIILQSWAVEASSSYSAQQAISLILHLKSAEFFVLVNIPLNFALKYWFGVTKILISSLKRLDRILVKWNYRHLPLSYSISPFGAWPKPQSDFEGKTSNSKCLLPVIIPISPVWSWDARLTELHLIDLTKLLPAFCYWTTLAHWTCSGLHLHVVLWSRSRLLSLLYLQFFSPHLI